MIVFSPRAFKASEKIESLHEIQNKEFIWFRHLTALDPRHTNLCQIQFHGWEWNVFSAAELRARKTHCNFGIEIPKSNFFGNWYCSVKPEHIVQSFINLENVFGRVWSLFKSGARQLINSFACLESERIVYCGDGGRPTLSTFDNIIIMEFGARRDTRLPLLLVANGKSAGTITINFRFHLCGFVIHNYELCGAASRPLSHSQCHTNRAKRTKFEKKRVKRISVLALSSYAPLFFLSFFMLLVIRSF